MKLSRNLVLAAGLCSLIAATYFGLGAADRDNVAQAQSTQGQSKWNTSTNLKLDSDAAKLGYTYGARVADDLVRSGVLDEIDVAAFIVAQQDIINGREPRMTLEEMQAAQQKYMVKQQEAFAALAAENKAKGEEFLAKNKDASGIVTTESGLQYQVVREGKGKQPTAENTVKIHYLGSLIDGTPFDSSYQREEPVSFPVSGVIPGFSEGLKLMKEGGKYRFVIPADLGYGEQGPPGIGPNQVLVFEVELIEVL